MEEATEKQISFANKLGIENPGQFSKQALRELIEKKASFKDKQAPKEPQKVYEDSFPEKKTTTMYVSYAKDILCAMINKVGALNKTEAKVLMAESIDLVKQAELAFK